LADLPGKVELYIPAPSIADKDEALQFHLATRNFFAWVFRRSLVGEHLGSALIDLMENMNELRVLNADNVGDLMNYLDEEGYLDMARQPVHSVAILRLAEHFKWKELYIESFAHCAGMSDRLYLCSEYRVSIVVFPSSQTPY
jgi:hypothetical protein